MNPCRSLKVLALYAGSGALILLAALMAGLPPAVFAVLLTLKILAAGLIALVFHSSPSRLKKIIALLLRIIYRPRFSGLENLAALKEGPTLVVANHTSFMDGPILAAFWPGPITFGIDVKWASAWWIRPFLRAARTLPIDAAQPLAARHLIECLERGEAAGIFPEGRISDTGSLMKIYEGPALIASRSRAQIMPVFIEGLRYRRFSRLRRLLLWPVRARVSINIAPPRRLDCPPQAGETQKDRRRRLTLALYDLMAESQLRSADLGRDLWTALKDAARRFGPNRPIMEDSERRPLTYAEIISRARLMGRALAAATRRDENVGLLLPNSNALTLALFGLWSEGRTAAMLNFSQGQAALNSAAATARIKTVVSSRRFLESSGLTALAEGLGVKLIHIEDLPAGRLEKLAARLRPGRPAAAGGPAVIVFTSGSEGRPKGAALSHANILANTYQFKIRLEHNENDIFFNAMPMFHAMGLTLCVIYPLLHGLRLFNYLTPLSAHLIPELIYDTRATVTVASDTLASLWARNAEPYDLFRMSSFISGSEKVKPATRRLFAEKFGVRLYEGYGVSETSPVLSVNSPQHYKADSVGRLLPGVSARLEPVEGVGKGGRLIVKGPNVMLGYIRPEEPGRIQPPPDGWHDTGDIVEIDADGFVWIKGRLKRFAKVAGEMVSLAAVEEVSRGLWPETPHAVIALEDESKGERLSLVSQDPAPDLPRLWQALKEAGLPEIAYPRQAVFIPEIPLTPLGKIALPALEAAVRSALAPANASEPG